MSEDTKVDTQSNNIKLEPILYEGLPYLLSRDLVNTPLPPIQIYIFHGAPLLSLDIFYYATSLTTTTNACL